MYKKDTYNINAQALDVIFNDIMQTWGDTYQRYVFEYESLRKRHPIYGKGGWGAPVHHPHRFVNLVMASTVGKSLMYSPGGAWIDVGTYDAALVSILRSMGLEAYGYDANNWYSMWDLLNVREYINSSIEITDLHVVTALNYAHSFIPEEFVNWVVDTFGEPDILVVDREERTPHPNNRLWYEMDKLEEIGFSAVVDFPELRNTGIEYGREVLIREKIH